MANIGRGDHDEPLIDVVTTISVGVHVFPRFLRAQVVVIQHTVSVVVPIVQTAVPVLVKLQGRLLVRTCIDQVGDAVVVPIVQTAVPIPIELRKSRLRWTRIKRVEHPVPVVVIKTRGIALNPLHCQGKPDRIAVQPDGALRTPGLDEAGHNVNVDVR